VLRDILRPKKDKASQQFRILHDEERRNLNTSRSVVRLVKCRRLLWAGHVARMRKQECIQDFGRHPLGRARRSCEDNRKFILGMELAQDRVQ